MSFKDCIQEGVNDGSYSQTQADDIKNRYDNQLAENQKSMSFGDAMAQSVKDVTDSVKYEKIQKKRQKLLQISAIKKLLADEAKYKNAFGQNDEFDFLEAVYTRDNYSNISSLEQRIDATTQLYLSDVNTFLWNNRNDRRK